MNYIYRSIVAGIILHFLPNLQVASQDTPLDHFYSGNYQQVIDQATVAIDQGQRTQDLFYVKALSEIQLGRAPHAIRTLEEALDHYPNNHRITRLLANQYDDAGDFVKAKELYIKLVLKDSLEIASRLKLAEIAVFRQAYKDAIPFLNQVLELDSTNLDGLLLMGEVQSRFNDSLAMEYYERAYDQYPGNQQVAFTLANLYIQTDKPEKASPLCHAVLELDSLNIKFHKLLGFAFYKMGVPSRAVTHLSRAVQLGDSTAFSFKFLGISNYMIVAFDPAIAALSFAVQKDSMDAENHFFLGASLGGTTRKTEAMYHLNRSIQLMEPDPAVVSRIYAEQGNILRLEMKYTDAYHKYQLAWETDTTNPVNLYYMASIQDNSLHKVEEALVDYQEFIDQLNKQPKVESRNDQIPTLRQIVEDRIVSLKEELFFLDK
jgi:tetratricopeptide (TPR) repeat protein